MDTSNLSDYIQNELRRFSAQNIPRIIGFGLSPIEERALVLHLARTDTLFEDWHWSLVKSQSQQILNEINGDIILENGFLKNMMGETKTILKSRAPTGAITIQQAALFVALTNQLALKIIDHGEREKMEGIGKMIGLHSRVSTRQIYFIAGYLKKVSIVDRTALDLLISAKILKESKNKNVSMPVL